MDNVPKPVADARTMAVPTRSLRGVETAAKSESQDLGASRGAKNGVLELRRTCAVGRDCRPAVGPEVGTVGSGADHRLDREHHAWPHDVRLYGVVMVQHLQAGVKKRPDAVADELAHHRISAS